MSTQQKPIEKQEISIFEQSLNWYIQQINSLMDTMPMIFSILASNTIMRFEKLKQFNEQYGLDKLKDNEPLSFPIEFYGCYERLTDHVEKAVEATMLYPCNMVVSFVSIYDAFVGNIIKGIYLTTPEKLNECNREIPIKELLRFASIDEAKVHIVEKEAETVLRSSHIEQLEWFGKKLGTSFNNFDSYSRFVEITERRNLYVHTNGTVSGQYLSVCSKEKVKGISEIKNGDRLSATPDYVTDCYNTLFEVGVQLGIVVWRILRKGDERADEYLNTVCYNLLKQKKYALAKVMLNFATETIKKHTTEEIKRYLIINKALTYYLSGDKKTCNTIIDTEDWSATAAKFQLAIAVLKEDYDTASKKMEESKSDINNVAYYEWPLFINFRNSAEFKTEYNRLFGQNFEYTEPQKENYEDILQYALDIQNKVKGLTKEEAKGNECSNCETVEDVLTPQCHEAE